MDAERNATDGEGDPLAEVRAMLKSGNWVPLFDPNSRMENGPSPMLRPEQWSVEKSNVVAHFLEVIDCPSASEWVRTETSLITTDSAGKRQLVDHQRPSVLVVNSVLSFIRQLVPEEKPI